MAKRFLVLGGFLAIVRLKVIRVKRVKERLVEFAEVPSKVKNSKKAP